MSRTLCPKGSQDDIDLEPPKKRFKFIDPNVARSAPPATRTATNATAAPSPLAARYGKVDKGKGKEVINDGAQDEGKNNFMRRFAGPSTGKVLLSASFRADRRLNSSRPVSNATRRKSRRSFTTLQRAQSISRTSRRRQRIPRSKCRGWWSG